MKKVIVILSVLLMLGGLGCAALSQLITPAEVDRAALKYAIDAGVAEPNDYNAWYPNLDEATRLKDDVDSAHIVNQEGLQHLIEKDVTRHGIHQKVTTRNRISGIQREELLFGETGILSLGLSMIGAGGFAGVLGLMRKRPGDVTPQELEQTVVSATGKTAEELSAKQKQFVQVVSGIQKFMDTYKDTSDNKEAVMLKEMKILCNATQDIDTRQAVAVAKTS